MSSSFVNTFRNQLHSRTVLMVMPRHAIGSSVQPSSLISGFVIAASGFRILDLHLSLHHTGSPEVGESLLIERHARDGVDLTCQMPVADRRPALGLINFDPIAPIATASPVSPARSSTPGRSSGVV